MVAHPPWPGPARDDAERVLRHAARYLRDALDRLEERWRWEHGTECRWEDPEVREWLVRRLEERLFGRTPKP